MTKSETFSTRIDPELKAVVENILSELGMTTSEAINIFFKQVALQKGLPFPVRIPRLTKSEIIAKIREAEDELEKNGILYEADAVLNEIGEIYAI
jgi:DNA-damage-inducible protein J